MTQACFHNRSPDLVSQSQLRQYEGVAERQERAILRYAMANPNMAFYDQDVLHLFAPNVPITSIRRAITNLKNAGQIAQAGTARGPHGHMARTYRLVPTPELIA